jgi:starvation-inducible DNA-binding protein
MAKKKTSTKSASKKSFSPVVEALREVLADSYALMGQTHICHWNVEGPSFFALHTAFEGQYTELFSAVDEIAERIRSLGAYAPGGLASLAALSGMPEIDEHGKASQMVSHLAKLHAKLIKDAVKARDVAADADDKETEDMMIGRIEVHQKTLWMLESFLKG